MDAPVPGGASANPGGGRPAGSHIRGDRSAPRPGGLPGCPAVRRACATPPARCAGRAALDAGGADPGGGARAARCAGRSGLRPGGTRHCLDRRAAPLTHRVHAHPADHAPGGEPARAWGAGGPGRARGRAHAGVAAALGRPGPDRRGAGRGHRPRARAHGADRPGGGVPGGAAGGGSGGPARGERHRREGLRRGPAGDLAQRAPRRRELAQPDRLLPRLAGNGSQALRPRGAGGGGPAAHGRGRGILRPWRRSWGSRARGSFGASSTHSPGASCRRWLRGCTGSAIRRSREGSVHPRRFYAEHLIYGLLLSMVIAAAALVSLAQM